MLENEKTGYSTESGQKRVNDPSAKYGYRFILKTHFSLRGGQLYEDIVELCK